MTEEPIHRRRSPRRTGESGSPGYTCPTECDDGCEASCHESHAVPAKRMHPVEVCESNVRRDRKPYPDGWYSNPDGCPCTACEMPYEPTWAEFISGKPPAEKRPPMPEPGDEESPLMRVRLRMHLCRVCGNKRCPAATDHRNVCHGSNEPGQEGSSYAADPREE